LRQNRGDNLRFVDLEYAATSQLPGYTALKSPPAGLFGGNPDLGREKSGQWLLSLGQEALTWEAKATLFYRRDDGLIDWTYLEGAPFARQANPVDVNVAGAEITFCRRWGDLDLAAGYTYLDKDGDYGAARVDASFYALNYARHRATVAATYRWSDRLEWRLDSEYRVNEDNPLRTTGDRAVLVSLALAWGAPHGEGPGLALTVDNLTDSDFEPFPGTPAVGRQVSLRASYGW
jgi:outer membrane cobalamin receptor